MTAVAAALLAEARTAIDPDGFLRTGDIATVDAHGIVTIVDRLKELIKYKGYQIAPAELEAVLLAHPQIADAAVIGVTADDGEEVPKAFVVPQSGAELGAEDVTAFAPGVDDNGSGSAQQAAGLAATFTGIGSKAGGQGGLTRLATPASKTVKKLFDSTEETSRFRLGFFRRQLFELSQQLTLAFGQVLRRFHQHFDVHVAGLARAQNRHALTANAELFTRLRAFRN